MAAGSNDDTTADFELVPDGNPIGRPWLLASLSGAILLIGGLGLTLSGGSVEQAERRETSIFTDTPSDANHYDPYFGATARAFGLCSDPPHNDCVVDGDTFWLNGREIRIANVDAPEMTAQCYAQANLAAEARRTLARVIDGVPLQIHGVGRDRDGRLIARVVTPKGDAGKRLLSWRVAVPWVPGQQATTDWCSGDF
jgi:micrococcal nuclease